MDVRRFPEHLTLLWEAPENVEEEVNNFVFEIDEINKTWSTEGPKAAGGRDVPRAGISA